MKKKIAALVLILINIHTLQAHKIEGTICDSRTREPLIGVSVVVEGTTNGTATDHNGRYALRNVGSGTVLNISYLSYKTIVTEPLRLTADERLDFSMESDGVELEAVVVRSRRNLEGEGALLGERVNANYAVENMGAKEMSAKGISTAADGVKKITGITMADAGQIFVRGLGDRYSTTTLNGLPIASPNPDNKLIPLDLFPASSIKNITVSKVFEASSFADYSGAHIDISTRESLGDDFLSVAISTGGNSLSTFGNFYSSDSRGLLHSSSISTSVRDMSPSAFSDYIRGNDPFGTSFSISHRKALPDFGATVSAGRTFDLGSGRLSVLVSANAANSNRTMPNSYVTTLTAQGTRLNEFAYDAYTAELRTVGLLNVGYSMRDGDRIGYTLFYARNAIDDYKRREGFDSEGVSLVGSNSVRHIYSLLNNQLNGTHTLGERLSLSWSGSYSATASDEPDRRQVMFRNDDGKLSLFKLNRQETMRYYGSLGEDEAVADAKLKYSFGTNNSLRVGAVVKQKSRDYSSTRFYYNLSGIDPSVSDIYDTDSYLNNANISDGTISITKDAQPKYSYYAGSRIWALFAETDYYLTPELLLNLGLRYENSAQWVRYWNDASIEKRSELSSGDLFPALNLKYAVDATGSLRLALSRTVTRPSFIEMAPFLYKESYGSAEIRGNEALRNGYNYNIDLRYEIIDSGTNDILSFTGYYKYLSSPIERIQESSGGSAVHSFRNAGDGMATGIEVELRRTIVENLRFGFNASYMYTNIVLPQDGGVYTDSQRALQGASPYIVNADLSYAVPLRNEGRLTTTVLYNLQGPRIHTVGIYGMSNVVEQEFHSLDALLTYVPDKHWTVKLQVRNLLDSAVSFTQEVKSTGQTVEVERLRTGISVELSAAYNF